MSITDAFYAFNFETSNAGEMPETSSFPDWLSRLAYQLINNEFDQLSVASPPNRRSSTSAAGAPAAVKSHEQHSLHNLSLLSPYKGMRRTPQHLHTPQNCCTPLCWSLLHECELTPLVEQKNPRRQCSVKNCKRKTELYCVTCSKIDHSNGHRLFFCCGAGQRVTVKQSIGGAAATTTITTPLCYKWHLEHCNDKPSSEDDDEMWQVSDTV